MFLDQEIKDTPLSGGISVRLQGPKEEQALSVEREEDKACSCGRTYRIIHRGILYNIGSSAGGMLRIDLSINKASEGYTYVVPTHRQTYKGIKNFFDAISATNYFTGTSKAVNSRFENIYV